jgi:hypothetical protein
MLKLHTAICELIQKNILDSLFSGAMCAAQNDMSAVTQSHPTAQDACIGTCFLAPPTSAKYLDKGIIIII